MSHGVEVKIDGTSIAPEQVREWERRRTQAAIGTMRRMLRMKGAASAVLADTPNHAIREHQWHLACELSNWAREILSREEDGTD